MELDNVTRPVPDSSNARRTKLVLLVGFGGLIALLIALGILAAITLERASSADTEQTTDYLKRRRVLGEARTAILSTGGSVRAYLLDPDEEAYTAHAPEARRGWKSVHERLNAYRRSSRTIGLMGQLESELLTFERLMEKALRLTGPERKRAGYLLLADEISPGRDRLLLELDNLAQVDRAALNATVEQTAAELRQLQSRLRTAVALSVALGLALAAVAYRYLVRLERFAADRYRLAYEAAERSEQLSHRLLSVQEQERKSLARELHDEVGQSLGALLVDLGQARAELHRDPKETRARLDAAAANAEQTLRSVRDISLMLRPSMLDELGLIPALHWQAREVSRRGGILTTVHCDDEDLALREELRTAVFRVVQEALQNALRHSGAKTAEVGIAKRDGHLHLIVNDDGRGFDPALARGMGLLGMEERVTRMGGRLRIVSAPGRGTTITADLPVSHS